MISYQKQYFFFENVNQTIDRITLNMLNYRMNL
jgi:hypothetical protein